ncbi:MAG: ywqD 1 [Candidatus Angelobacter sp.]|nr:ywqD 1 [Candidatus Angelobacter sp.]
MSRFFELLNKTAGQTKQRGSPWDLLLAPQVPNGDAQQMPSEVPIATTVPTAPTINEAPALAFEPHSKDRIFALHNDRNLAAENIRILAGRLNYLQRQLLFKTLLISGTTKGEGKTVIAANLAITLASRDNKRVLLIDGDTRQASVSRLFNAESSPGLNDCLSSGTPPFQFLRRMPTMSLWLLPVGHGAETPLRAGQLGQLLARLSVEFEWIIIDSAPITLLANAAAWAVAAERYLLVVRRGVTPKKMFSKALESIDQNKLLGAVMNDCIDQSQTHYTRYYQQIARGEDTSSSL